MISGQLFCIGLAVILALTLFYYNYHDQHSYHSPELLLIDIGANLSGIFLIGVLLYTAFVKEENK